MDRLRLSLLTLLLALTVLFVIRFSSILGMFAFAIAMACIFMPVVNWVERFFMKRKADAEKYTGKGIRGMAVLMVTVVSAWLMLVLIGMLVPYLMRQVGGLISDFPAMYGSLQDWLISIEPQLVQMKLPLEITEPISRFISQIDHYLLVIATNFIAWLAKISSGILNLVIIFILQIYFLMDGPRIVRLGREYLLKNHLNRIAGFLRTSTQMVTRYLKAQVVISGSMAVTAFIGLKLIGIGYTGLFSLMLFVLDFIPYIGSISGTVILIVFALITADLKTAVIVGLFLLVLQQLEGNVLAPKIQGKTVGVHAAVIMLSLLACFELWGPVGMLFSVLLAGMIKIILADVLEYLLHPEITIGEFLSSGYPLEVLIEDTDKETEQEDLPQKENPKTELQESLEMKEKKDKQDE